MDSPSGGNSSQPTTQICPFAEKCYRKNPVHFSEMRHPHLEQLVETQLEGPVQLPGFLGFDCRDRSLLLDQLKIVQMVLRKEKGIPNVRTPSSQSSVTNSPARPPISSISIQNSSGTLLSSPGTLLNPQKPQNPPASSTQLSNSQLSSSQSSIPSSQLSQFPNSPLSSSKHQPKLLNSPAPPSKPNPPAKREILDSPDSTESKKPKETPKSPTKKSQSPPRTSQPQNPPQNPPPTQNPPSGSSLFDKYFSCTTQSSREDLRKHALMQMIKANQRLPHLASRGEFDMKYACSAPYYVFLTVVQDSSDTWSQPFSITFPEILDTSLGEIEESLHINFMVDVGWLCLQYLFACQPPKMLILLGQRCDTQPLPQGIKVVKVEPPSKYGTHHSKISVLKYKNGVRIIVSTANLYDDDWQNRTQALWMSPHLPELPPGADKTLGESRTGFKADFLRYLENYGASRVKSWLEVLERTDFSSIDVFFLASVPGNHKEGHRDRYGLRRLAVLLKEHAVLPADGAKWPVVAQSSSIGSLGTNFGAWVGNDVVGTLSSETGKGLRSAPNFQFIYPTVENFRQSFDMSNGSCCLPYGKQMHDKQKWLNNYCYKWKSDGKHRSQAMPHVKSYTRISPDFKKIPWIVITSANLSKAAWGWGGKNTNTILSYEAGVVLFPKFLTKSTTFPLQEPDETGAPPFPLPYDVPLTPYTPRDEIFTMDFFND